MVIKFKTTKLKELFVKCLVYGVTGVGKTMLIATAPKPIIISAEKGLLTLKDYDIPVIEVSSFEDLEDAYTFVTTSPKAANFETICLDSITDMAETLLAEEKEKAGKDPRNAYGNYNDKLLVLLKKFRDIEGRNIYFTAQQKATEDEMTKVTSYGPSLPGKKLAADMPYIFDFVFALRMGKTEEGEVFRYLQTEPDIQYTAKARGGMLDAVEDPNLLDIFKKALGLPDEPVAKAKKEKKEVVVEESPEDGITDVIGAEDALDEESAVVEIEAESEASEETTKEAETPSE